MKKNFLLSLVLLFCAAPLWAQTVYVQGFEVDNSGWAVFSGLHANRVASGTNGVTSNTGSFHAEAIGSGVQGSSASSAATNWGGYSCVPGCATTTCAAGGVFPAAGYVTAVDIYLNLSATSANDTRFDFSSAINVPAGSHRRDFVFNAGFYNDTDVTGSGPRFVISASNNAGRANSFPRNPGRDPFAVTATGWYTFQHTFYDNGSGVLAVELSIINSSGTTIKTWTLSDASDIIGTTVGGNRYGWFANNEFSFLAIDNATMLKISTVQPFVFLADTEIELDHFGFVEGDLHSNGNIEYDNGRPSTHTGSAAAVGNIEVARDNTVTGDLTAGGTIGVDDDATIGGVITSSAAVDPLALPSLSFSCPASNGSITAGKDKQKNVAPGDYNTLRADKNAQLNLSAGEYSVGTLRLDDRSRLFVDVSGGEVTINVCTEINFIKNADIIISGGDSKALTINFSGTKKVVLGKDGGYQGSFVAPNALVEIGSNAGFLGSIAAKSIAVNKDARVRHHDLGPSIPKAQPANEPETQTVADYVLEQNYPNPFNPSTKIRFGLVEPGNVQVLIYNHLGQVVRTLAQAEFAAGRHDLSWDGRNETGDLVATGVYFYRVNVSNQTGATIFSETRSMTFLK